MGSISSLPPEVKDVTERYGFCIVDDRFDSEDAEYLIDKPYITTWPIMTRLEIRQHNFKHYMQK